ncbi:hypothetical protein AC529_16265 [Thermobifida cellulosilytica TB100]|uniref:DUF4446 domain-containing protein n=1 Tax=Thermobifida cellulosilytica TB100 TaxID=665004 RepID=A0A147KEH2_THECS|nr:hypothetical protein AC529_16265 [Thermobifida cellulosilytica TB100]
MLLSVTGALLGAGGLLFGLLAFWRTRTAIGDCHVMIRNSLAAADGIDPHAIRNAALVYYDALEERFGARSFSLALLDSAGDGVVLTSINGRAEARTYAKAVVGGRAVEPLSPEEQRAVRAARLGRRTPLVGEAAPVRLPVEQEANEQVRQAE